MIAEHFPRCRAWAHHRASGNFSLLLVHALVWTIAHVNCVIAQQLLVNRIDVQRFPQVSIELYSFDETGKPALLDPPQDRSVTEYLETVRQTLATVSCPSIDLSTPSAAVFAFDWASAPIRQSATAMLQQWVRTVPQASHVGVIAFGERPYLLCDLSDQVTHVVEHTDKFPPVNTAAPLPALQDSLLGAIAIVTRTLQQQWIILVTEHAFPKDAPPLLHASILDNGIRLVVVAVQNTVPQWLRELCIMSGGIAIDDVAPERIERVARMLAAIASGYRPCRLTWQSLFDCTSRRQVQIDAPSLRAQIQFQYDLSSTQLPLLDVVPRYRDFGTLSEGVTPAQEIVLTALNSDITLLSITADPTLEIVEGGLSGPLRLRGGENYRLRVRLQLRHQERTFGTLNIVSTACNGLQSSILAANTDKPITTGVHFLRPAQDSLFLFEGMPVHVQWTGTLPSDSVALFARNIRDTGLVVLANNMVGYDFLWLPLQAGVYKLELRSKRGDFIARSGVVVVQRPPLRQVTVSVPTIRVGTAREFTTTDALCSDTTINITIDSVRFRSGRSFQLARRVTGIIPPLGCTSFIIIFAPTEPGLHRDTLVISTSIGVRHIDLEGIALEPQLLMPRTILLRSVPLGIRHDTLVQWLLCVLQPNSIQLVPEGPDTTQLQLLTIRKFSLDEQTPCLAYPFRLQGLREGRSCMRLLVQGQEWQPYECVLVADVICSQPYPGAMLFMPPVIATQTGRVVRVPVWMPSVPPSFRTMNRPFRFHVRCNASVLLPEYPLDRGTIIDGERIITVQGQGFASGDTLTILRFSTYWGDSPQTTLRIENFQWQDRCPLPLAATAATVTLTDYCTAGGSTRLFLVSRPPRIERIEPMPSNGNLVLVISAPEQMDAELHIYSVVGILRWHQQLHLAQNTNPYHLDVALPPGHYMVQLRSHAGIDSTSIVITR